MFVIRVPEFQKTNSDHSGKQKIWHATSVAIFWDNFNKILRQNLSEKTNGEHCEKMNIKTDSYIPLCQIKVYLENSRSWDQILPKERRIKILRNRHWIHIQHNTSNSCAKFHLICRIINFESKSKITLWRNIKTTQPKNDLLLVKNSYFS